MASSKPAARMPALLLTAAALAAANGLWSGFLWQQLLVSRRGGDPFCALGGEGCGALWDGAFASQIHATTGLPVAAWGLAWSLAAMALPLWAWQRARTGRAVEPAWTGAVLLAAAGGLSIPGLLAASAIAGDFCSSCAITYVLVALYAGAVFVATAVRGPRSWARGAGFAAAAIVASYFLLLAPGRATPGAGDGVGGSALLAAGESGDSGLSGLRGVIGALPARDRQTLANVRARYASGRAVAAPPPRALIGPADAGIRITTFTDSGCSHCRTFHEALETMLDKVPPGSVAIDQRVFPLDGACNSEVSRLGHPELCLAAQVRVCLERDPRALDLTGWLHVDAAPLRTESIYRVAERLTPRSNLDACVDSAETAARIREDVAFAMDAGIQGTPFILVNGKPAAAYIPFLYALAWTGGDAGHEVFAGLPAPVAGQPGHEGHDH